VFKDAISYCSAIVTSPASYPGVIFFKHGERKRHLQMMKFFPLFYGTSSSIIEKQAIAHPTFKHI
jgi:hypothetical protein